MNICGVFMDLLKHENFMLPPKPFYAVMIKKQKKEFQFVYIESYSH